MWLAGIIEAQAGLLLAKARTFFTKQGPGRPVDYLPATLPTKSSGHSHICKEPDAVIHLKSRQFVLLDPAEDRGAGSSQKSSRLHGASDDELPVKSEGG